MTPQEHYEIAEELIERAHGQSGPAVGNSLALAAVHATLAAAGMLGATLKPADEEVMPSA